MALASLDAKFSFPLFCVSPTRIYFCCARFVLCWTTATMLPFFSILKITGMLRVSVEDEIAGMDASEHGGGVY